jgi:hypothetical protein
MATKHFGTAAEYAAALKEAMRDASGKQIDLLRAHCVAPKNTTTWSSLAQEVGYKNFRAVNLHYGVLAHRVGTILGRARPPEGFWLFVLVHWADRREPLSDHTQFVLRPQVIDALRLLGYSWANGKRSNRLKPTSRRR